MSIVFQPYTAPVGPLLLAARGDTLVGVELAADEANLQADLHRRFKGCNEQVRAKGQGRGAEDYVNLELYLAWRGQGLEVETPAVRR